eukprot:TRINITY_DN5792_c0_g1_i1.p1 TRINITY_DN5792_c0_g1~~TRINITY_DN5792_c0_g1_i1.p1  ORF type:complete len:249 (+),score=40.59 TRINITY_DN5792_c0_g1_i1:72-818(+)
MSEFLDEMIHKLGLFLVLALIWFLSAEGRPLPQFLDYRAAYKTSSGGALHTTNLWSLYSEKKMKMTYDDGKGDMIGALLYLDSPKGSTTAYHFYKEVCRKEQVEYVEGEELSILPLAGKNCREEVYKGVSSLNGKEVESWEVSCSIGRSVLHVSKGTDVLVRVDRILDDSEVVSVDIDLFELIKPTAAIFELPTTCTEEGLKFSQMRQELREQLQNNIKPRMRKMKKPTKVDDEDEEEWEDAKNVYVY